MRCIYCGSDKLSYPMQGLAVCVACGETNALDAKTRLRQFAERRRAVPAKAEPEEPTTATGAIAAGTLWLGMPPLANADEETPQGPLDAAGLVFTLKNSPFPAASLILSNGGMVQRSGPGNDFVLNGNVITFAIAPQGAVLQAWYRYSKWS